MPRGITQDQVNQAADTIVAAGERPTVERIRAHLGTGSPNTITRMLDSWRQSLAERLREVSQLPGLPDDIGQAMTGLWAQAMQHAREQVQSELQREREALEQARTSLDARSAEQTALLAAAQTDSAKSAEAARRATVQAETLQRLVDRLEAEVRERAQQGDQLIAKLEGSAATESTLRDRIQAMEEKSAQERSKSEQHIQTIEDRAHTQVDRARTDLKAVRAELADARRQHRKDERALQQQITEVAQALAASERQASHQQGVAEALALKLGKTRQPARRKPAGRKKAAPKRPRSTQRD